MALTMSGEVQINASRETVYQALNDTEILKACVPGCEMLEKISDTEFQAISVMKIGPVKPRAAMVASGSHATASYHRP